MRLTNIAAIILACLASLSAPEAALAVPSLPCSFYGSVTFNNSNVPDGTLIQALIEGQVYGETHTQTYEGQSVYSIDVRGDDSDTTARDGGREGDIIVFRIGGIASEQTGTWHGGVLTKLDLTALSPTSLATPQLTSTAPASQTPILPASATARPAQTSAAPQVHSSPESHAATPFSPAELVPSARTQASISNTRAAVAATLATSSPTPARARAAASATMPAFPTPEPITPETGRGGIVDGAAILWLLILGAILLAAFFSLRSFRRQ